MKYMKVLFFLTMLFMSLAFTFSEGESLTTNDNAGSEFNSLKVKDRFFPYHRRFWRCQISPSVCHDEGSSGPHCCINKCVNFKTDQSNCGRCGKKCGFRKMCCEGKCVNPMTSKKHCGKCGNKCGKGSSCVYGMCSYA